MRRYRFRLESVLRVRRREEERARATLAAAAHAVRAAEEQLTQRTSEYERGVQAAPGSSLAAFRREQQRRDALAAAVVAQQAELARARAEQERARQEWSAAALRVEALERLDERARAEHRVAERREEDLLADELVVTRHGREAG